MELSSSSRWNSYHGNFDSSQYRQVPQNTFCYQKYTDFTSLLEIIYVHLQIVIIST